MHYGEAGERSQAAQDYPTGIDQGGASDEDDQKRANIGDVDVSGAVGNVPHP